MMGLMSNQVSDSLWTSRGVDQGFLSTMGYVSTNQKYFCSDKTSGLSMLVLLQYIYTVLVKTNAYFMVQEVYYF